jgi:hypothetical protein
MMVGPERTGTQDGPILPGTGPFLTQVKIRPYRHRQKHFGLPFLAKLLGIALEELTRKVF